MDEKDSTSIKTDDSGYTNADGGQSVRLIAQLQQQLPSHSIILPDAHEFRAKVHVHWAQQERENVPGCIVVPRSAEEVGTIVKIIKQEFDQNRSSSGKPSGLFAIRSGGHSPSTGAASIDHGVLVDLSSLNSVSIANDRETVEVGAGARWIDVTKVLDAANLAVVGGRSSQVGVGGLTLGGGISYFSPRFGLVCANVVSYEIVLASGTIITASATSHPRLWRALKGGLNNFGIVTKFTFRAFPSSNFWSGWLYMPPFQPQKAMAAFHEFAGRRETYDPYAGGPILVFSFVYPYGIKVVTCNLAYTKEPDGKKSWPDCFTNSGFSSLWRLRSTCKIQSLTSMTDEMDAATPPGKRQMFATTTIRNDLETMKEAHAIVTEANATLRSKGLKTWYWGFILQPIFPDMMRKGNGNCAGLDQQEDTLVILSFSIAWKDAALDGILKEAAKSTIDLLEAMAQRRGTWHPFKNVNYCGSWQDPFQSYGEENVKFLREVSREVDPDRLFQHACPGGFKIWEKDAS